MEDKRWPDFIVIGAGKSGTTALNKYLEQHREIFMATQKEPNFFALESVDINDYEIEESREYHLQSVYEKDKYLDLFKGARRNQVLGEISNLYLNSEIACQSIKGYVPDAKLIALLRQPTDRLYSRYLHLVREESVPKEGWDELFDKQTIWWRRPDLIKEGFYYRHLKTYFDTFPREQIRVYLYDDFRDDPAAILRDIFRFIGVNEKEPIDTDLVVNKSGRRKDNLFNKLLGQNGAMINLSKTVLPGMHENLKNNRRVVKYLNKARNRYLESERMPSELRSKITNEIYREDIENLGKLLGRDLSSWLQSENSRSVGKF